MVSEHSEEKIHLGREDPEGFIRNIAMDRSAVINELRMVERECWFSLADIGGLRKNGVFYTDEKGKRILMEPGPIAARRFIKPDFNAIITWDGMYEVTHTGFFTNVGYGVNPDKNSLQLIDALLKA